MAIIGQRHSGSFGSGANHHNWKGGITPLNKKLRTCARFNDWRKKVFTRDKYTCQECHVTGGILHPDHIKSLSLIVKENKIDTLYMGYECKELWDIDNGRTLCVKCHGNKHGILFNPRGNRNYRELVCLECKKDFKVSTRVSKIKPRKFCGRKCSGRYLSKNPNSGVFKKGIFYKSSRNVNKLV